MHTVAFNGIIDILTMNNFFLKLRLYHSSIGLQHGKIFISCMKPYRKVKITEQKMEKKILNVEKSIDPTRLQHASFSDLLRFLARNTP